MISQKDRALLRELAKQQMEYANLPVMAERKQRWYDFNDNKRSVTPMVTFEMCIRDRPCETSGRF